MKIESAHKLRWECGEKEMEIKSTKGNEVARQRGGGRVRGGGLRGNLRAELSEFGLKS